MALGKKGHELTVKIIRYIVILVFVVPMMLPLLWMLSTALKEGNMVFTNPPQWIPKTFAWENFSKGLETVHFWSRFLNTLFITVLCCIGQVLSCMCVGYAIGRIKFPGRKVWFYMIVGSMMLPGMVTMIPVFKVWSSLGFVNSYVPLIVPAFLGSPFYTFMVRQFMTTIPRSYDEAARIDGASRLQILVRVIAPMCKPVMATIVVMQFQASWNDYLAPLLYIIDEDKWTLAIGIAQMSNSNYGVQWNTLMAADVVYLLPMLILFFLAQDFFMQGLGSMNSAGVK